MPAALATAGPGVGRLPKRLRVRQFKGQTFGPLQFPVELAGTSRSGAADSTSFTGDTSWTHTPTVNQPKGVLVVVSQPLTTADEIAAVTYGGITMSRVLSQASTQVEASRGYIYHLGTNIPSGPQTVFIDTNATTAQKQAQCFTVTGGEDLQVVTDSSAGVNLGLIANPSTTANFTTELPAWFGLALHFYGGAAPIATGLRPGEQYAYGHDPGAAVSMTYYRNQTLAASNTTFGYTTLASDDQFIMWVVLKQVVQYSFNVAISEDTALPSWRFKGRLATLVPNGTAKGDWTVVGAASAEAAVTDASDASYIESTTTGNIERLSLTTTTLQAGEFVSGVRIRTKATTNPNQTISVGPQAVAGVGLFNAYDTIPVSAPNAWYTTPMFPGASDPMQASGFGPLDQAKIDAMLVQYVLTEGAAEAATTKVFETAVDLYISQAQPQVIGDANKLIFEDGSATRFVGVNWPEDVLETPLAETKERLLAHKDAGYNLFRFHIPTSRLRDTAVWFLPPMALLVELLQWMNDEDLYADLTMNATYRTEDNPAWMEAQTEGQRWDLRREIGRMLCGTFEAHPAVAFFNLMNEGRAPTSPVSWWRFGDTTGTDDVLYSEHVVKDRGGRSFVDTWEDWLDDVMSVTDGIGLVAPDALVGVGEPIVLAADTESVTPASAFLSGCNVLLPHLYPDRDSSWRPRLDKNVRFGLPVVVEEFFVDIISNIGWIPEMDAVYAEVFDMASGITVMSQGLTGHGYPVGISFGEAIHKAVLLWMEDRMDQFRHTPKYSLRVGTRAAVPFRVGYRI